MYDALVRLYQTKLVLLAIVFLAVGAILMFIGHSVDQAAGPVWLQTVPFGEFGATLLTAGLFGVLLYYLDQEDANIRARERLDKSLKQAAPAIRDAVIEGFAFQPDDLAKVSSSQTLDRIATNSLAIQLGDRELATDIYTDLRRQVLNAPERCYDMRVSVSLTPWERGPRSGSGSMFVATVRREYKVKPVNPVLRFSCVSDLDEYRELLRDPTTTEAWYFEPVAGLEATSPEVFELLQFTVDGKTQPIRGAKRATAQLFTVSLRHDLPTEQIQISYTYRVLVQRHGHLLYLDVDRPCKGLKVELRYGGCGIQHMNVLDFVTSARPAQVLRAPNKTTPSVSVGFDGWLLPKAGVVFGWVLGVEMQNGRSQPPASGVPTRSVE